MTKRELIGHVGPRQRCNYNPGAGGHASINATGGYPRVVSSPYWRNRAADAMHVLSQTLGLMLKKDLQRLCRKLSISDKGKRSELVDRIKEHARNLPS